MRDSPVRLPVVLVAHGSRDPRAAATTRALARVVARLSPGSPVRVAFLDHAGPRVGEALRPFGADEVAVVPLLLTAAYHGRVDLPAALAEARAAGIGTGAMLTDALGPTSSLVPAALLAGLRRARARRRRYPRPGGTVYCGPGGDRAGRRPWRSVPFGVRLGGSAHRWRGGTRALHGRRSPGRCRRVLPRHRAAVRQRGGLGARRGRGRRGRAVR